jgi:DNA-binding CsgD family transcriptional regulator
MPARVPSPRQQQVIEFVARGLKNSEVAEIIGTTEYVAKNHLRAIFDKLGFWNRVELALWYEARIRKPRLRTAQSSHGLMRHSFSLVAQQPEEKLRLTYLSR